MTVSTTERRRHARQAMNLSVTCCHLEQSSDTSGSCLGKISDASMGGVRVQVNSDINLIVGNKLVLLVIPKEDNHTSSHELPGEIRGEVVWQNPHQRSFGLKFLL